MPPLLPRGSMEKVRSDNVTFVESDDSTARDAVRGDLACVLEHADARHVRVPARPGDVAVV